MDNAGRQRLFGAESIKAAAVERAGQGNENSLTRSRDQIADQLAIYAGAVYMCICLCACVCAVALGIGQCA